MGTACCKRLDSQPRSPHLPVSEVFRRLAQQMCPVDPPIQKPVYSPRKYNLSDIVGPVVKKDSWCQTDPLPPPRHRKAKRRRSRSAEFIPYLVPQRDPRTSPGSLEDITGHEDVFDFQMYFMGRLPNELTENVKETLPAKKKEFLSGLLGEESKTTDTATQDKEESKVLEEVKMYPRLEEAELQKSSPEVKEPAVLPVGGDHEPQQGTSSRRSSITESLKEFESSLLEMLDEEEGSLPGREFAAPRKDTEDEDDEGVVVRMMVPFKRKDLPPLKEEREEDYILTPLEEEREDEIEDDIKDDKKVDECNNHAIIETPKSALKCKNMTDDHSMNDFAGYNREAQPFGRNSQPPKITVEIVS